MCAKVDDQLRERDAVIALREEHILRLREAEKHLEGFRFVLFHKVRALEAERGPLEEKVEGLRCEQQDLAAGREDSMRFCQHMYADLQEIMEGFDETTVKRRVRDVLKKYNPSKPRKKKKGSEQRLPLITEDGLKQRDILLRSGVSASNSVEHILQEQRKDHSRMMAEFGQLTTEVNLVKTEKESFKRREELLTADVAELERKLGGIPEDEGAGPKKKRATQTPYMRRLHQSQSDQQLTKQRAWRNQLPPPQAGQVHARKPMRKKPRAGTGTGSVEEMQFDELLSSLDDTREMMEQQGFKMGKLHADVEHMVAQRMEGQQSRHLASTESVVTTEGPAA